jgi:cytochrome P450
MTTTAPVPSCPIDASFDPLSPEFLADPYAAMSALSLDGTPVFFAPSIGYYVITRYADIEAVFRDPAAYSAAVAQAPLVPLVAEAQRILLAGGHKPAPTMVSLDEPDHARLRKPAGRAFSMKRVTAMIGTIEATTKRLLDQVAAAPEFDLVAALAFPLPANIVFSLMGVPERDFAQLKYWCGYRAALSWGRPAPEDQVEIATTITAYRGYIRDLVDVKVRAPGDDLTSDLIAIHDEDLWLAAAGRDAAAFDRPDQFDLHRADAGRHLAFGQGLHFCLGANLGKLEAQIAVAELARRYPDLQLAPDQQFTFHPNISFRGPQVLTVRRG